MFNVNIWPKYVLLSQFWVETYHHSDFRWNQSCEVDAPHHFSQKPPLKSLFSILLSVHDLPKYLHSQFAETAKSFPSEIDA